MPKKTRAAKSRRDAARSTRARAPKRSAEGDHRIAITVNGTRHERTVEPRTLLVDLLRDHLRLTGAHVGCDTSQCGACTVIVDGRAIKSCTMFAVQADGMEVLTIEGLASHGRMHPIQQAFKDNHGLQCGYCTPGVVLAAYELLQNNPSPTEEEIRIAVSGNLCRCTGYQGIVRSVAAAAALAAVDGGN